MNPATARMHVSLDVTDLDRSVGFYSALFDMPPTKVRPGYAKFDAAQPAVVLSLIQRDAVSISGVSHMGVRVDSDSDLAAMRTRLSQAGLAGRDENNITCCYATQDKLWLTDPTGYRWEVYRVKAEAESFWEAPPGIAAATPSASAASCSCCAR